MQIGILILLLAALVLLNYRIARSVLYPPFVFSVMWLLVFSIYETNLIEIDPLHFGTLLLVGSGAVLFSFGGLLAKLVPEQIIGLHVSMGPFSKKPTRNTWSNYLALAVCFVGMVLIIKATFALGAGVTGGNVLSRARSAGVAAQVAGAGTEAEGPSNPLTVYTPVWSLLFSIFFLLERKKRLFWVMATISFVASLFTTGRGPIIMLFCSLMAAYLFREKWLQFNSAVKMLRIPVAVVLSLYVILIFTTKDLSTIGDMSVIGIIIFFVGGYFISPVAALDYVLQHPEQYGQESQHTFKFFLGAAAKLHLASYQPPPLLDEFVTVPLATNVYTGFKFYYTDFGVWGCLAIVTAIAFLHTLLYRKAAGGSELGVFFYSATIFPLVMFIFDDLYSAFGEHLDILAVGCLYFATRSFLVPDGLPRYSWKVSIPKLRLLPARMMPRVTLLGRKRYVPS